MTVPTPMVGETYLLADEDYQYGSGPLLCRVTKVVRETVYANEPWWEVTAMCKPPTSASPAYERQLYINASILKSARRSS